MEQLETSTPPDKPSGGAPGGEAGGNANISYAGATTISTDKTVANEVYSSSAGGENALLISGGQVSLDNVTIEKTGDDSGDSSDFYGTNAALLAYSGADISIVDSTITTDGAHANAVFAYGDAKINLANTMVITTSNNSGGIMVTGGGTINATDISVSTEGNSSAPIRSDRGGGTINVEGGSYISQGVGSPVIYSTANISAKEASLISSASEGVVIEGKNSVSLDTVILTATNEKLNGLSETYKTIFIYQSMSGDASEGTGTFTAKDSLITSNNGDIFFITNTDALIELSGNKFVQNDDAGAFLRASTSAWGNTGSNGGNVTLNATDQEINGDIIIDDISSLTMKLKHSYFNGTFTGGGEINLTVSKDSIVVLTADSHVTSLDNADITNQNIYSNGYKLYVNNAEVAVNSDEAPESFLEFDESRFVVDEEVVPEETTVTTTGNTGFPTWGYFAIGGGMIAGIIALVIVLVFIKKKGKGGPSITGIPQAPQTPQSSQGIPNIADEIGMPNSNIPSEQRFGERNHG